jgi:hypothetical protein
MKQKLMTSISGVDFKARQDARVRKPLFTFKEKCERHQTWFPKLESMRAEPLIRQRCFERIAARKQFKIVHLDAFNDNALQQRRAIRSKGFFNIEIVKTPSQLLEVIALGDCNVVVTQFNAHLESIKKLCKGAPLIITNCSNEEELDFASSLGDVVSAPYSHAKLMAKVESYYNSTITELIRQCDIEMGSAKPSILIVDEDQIHNECLLEKLSKEYHVTVATSFAEGMELLVNGKFNIVLSEIKFSNGNGSDYASYIKAHKPTVSLIYLTNVGGYYRIPADTLKFDKPASISELKLIIEELIDIKQENEIVQIMLKND